MVKIKTIILDDYLLKENRRYDIMLKNGKRLNYEIRKSKEPYFKNNYTIILHNPLTVMKHYYGDMIFDHLHELSHD